MSLKQLQRDRTCLIRPRALITLLDNASPSAWLSIGRWPSQTSICTHGDGEDTPRGTVQSRSFCSHSAEDETFGLKLAFENTLPQQVHKYLRFCSSNMHAISKPLKIMQAAGIAVVMRGSVTSCQLQQDDLGVSFYLCVSLNKLCNFRQE